MTNAEETTTKPESIEDWRKRLKFRSWHRGTREMDLLMGTFADKHLPDFTEEQLQSYENALGYSDPDLYNWYSGREDIPANVECDVLLLFKAHKYSFG